MTAANKAFAAITIVGPFLIAAIAILPGMLAQRQASISEETTVGFVREAAGEAAGAASAAEAAEGERVLEELNRRLDGTLVQLEAVADREQAKAMVQDEAIHGALVLSGEFTRAERVEYYSRTGTDMHIAGLLEGVIGQAVFEERVANAGFDPGEIQRLTARPEVILQRVADSGDADGSDFMGIILTVITFVMMIYMTVLLYGQMIGRSVLMEKTAKTVEIMLSSVRPSELLFGKILGKGLAAMLQYAIWIGMALLLLKAIGPRFDIQPPPALTAGNLGFLLMFFLLAFFLYSAAYAAIGAGAEDEQHLGQLSMPLVLFLIVPLVLVSPMVMNPSGVLVVALSYFPFTSPIVMLIRVLVDMPAAWELLLCAAILVGSILLTGFGAARVFRIGILMSGARKSWKDLFRWAAASTGAPRG